MYIRCLSIYVNVLRIGRRQARGSAQERGIVALGLGLDLCRRINVTCAVLSIVWQAIAANGVPYSYWHFYPAARAVNGVGGTVFFL